MTKEESEKVLYATLDIPEPKKTYIKSQTFLPLIGDFNKQVTEMIVALGAKEPDDELSLEFTFRYHVKGIKFAVLDDAGDPKTFKIRCYCNGE